jgi:hypothetical protein
MNSYLYELYVVRVNSESIYSNASKEYDAHGLQRQRSPSIDDGGKVRAPSTVFGFINAVKNAHTEKNERLSGYVCMLIKKYEEAYKRTVSKLRQKGIMAATKGKHCFSMSIYGELCKLALYASENRRNYSRFVHTYMAMCWNLFQR